MQLWSHFEVHQALDNQKSENEPQAKRLDLIFYSTLGPARPIKNAVQNSCIPDKSGKDYCSFPPA